MGRRTTGRASTLATALRKGVSVSWGLGRYPCWCQPPGLSSLSRLATSSSSSLRSQHLTASDKMKTIRDPNKTRFNRKGKCSNNFSELWAFWLRSCFQFKVWTCGPTWQEIRNISCKNFGVPTLCLCHSACSASQEMQWHWIENNRDFYLLRNCAGLALYWSALEGIFPNLMNIAAHCSSGENAGKSSICPELDT